MYDHYIAFDWAQSNVAIARMSKNAKKIHCFETQPNTAEIRTYLKCLKGRKILTIEESTTAQWLYTEFKESVDELIICDPRRNHLLREGAKTDRLDAVKLVQLLKADMLKPVFHSADQFIYLRKIVSGYDDLVKLGVRAKNQSAALLRSNGFAKHEDPTLAADQKFVMEGIKQHIELYEQEKERYENEFARLRASHQTIKNLASIPGIADINAVKIAATIVDARRFPTKNHFLSYCGLVKLEKVSGGKSYGKKSSNYCRTLKCVFKGAAITVLRDGNQSHFNSYYHYLVKEKNFSEFNARHAVARRIAVVAWGVMKSGKRLNAKKLKTIYN